jgi:hypothetical protein
MKRRRWTPGAARTLKAGATLAALSYAGYAGFSWLRYGRPKPPSAAEADPLLDRFIPSYDVVERHHIRVAAPPAVVLKAAKEQSLFRSGPVKAIFRARQLVLGATGAEGPQAETLLEEVQALGWRILVDEPGHEIVLGAVTKPWEANVTFRGLSPEDFRAFEEPGYVKIAWTLRADPIESGGAIFRTETRATATDRASRARFRSYWSFASPGIALIRWLSLLPLKREAERRNAED